MLTPTANKMIINALLLSLAIATTAAKNWDPDCTRCEYQNGIGFLSGEYCNLYYMCTKNANFGQLVGQPGVEHDDLYSWDVMCCPAGQSWNQEHLTCIRDSYCEGNDTKCPDPRTTTDFPCPMYPNENDATKYFSAGYEEMMCPYGSVWSQDYCTCIFNGPYEAPCRKILSYEFTDGTFNSKSCYNFAQGVPYGNPEVIDDMLCLNNRTDANDQFLSIPFLNNWFAWNPIGSSFTLCFWLRVKEDQTAGVFSTGSNSGGDPLFDLYLQDGELVANMAGTPEPTGQFPSYSKWSKVCVVCDRGSYIFYYNAYVRVTALGSAQPINSQKDATVGFVRGFTPVIGYFDDICFYTYALSFEEMIACYNEGPSSPGEVEPRMGEGEIP